MRMTASEATDDSLGTVDEDDDDGHLMTSSRSSVGFARFAIHGRGTSSKTNRLLLVVSLAFARNMLLRPASAAAVARGSGGPLPRSAPCPGGRRLRTHGGVGPFCGQPRRPPNAGECPGSGNGERS